MGGGRQKRKTPRSEWAERGRWDWLARMIRDRALSAEARVLGVLLLGYSDSNCGECWPGQARLASDLGANDRSIRRGLGQLEALGFVEQIRPAAPGRNQVLRLRDPGRAVSTGGKNVPEDRAAHRPVASGEHRPVASGVGGEHRTSVTGTPDVGVRCHIKDQLSYGTKGAGAPEREGVSAEDRRRSAIVLAATGAWLGAPLDRRLVTVERVEALVAEGRLTADRGAELLAGHLPRVVAGGEGAP